MSTLSERFWSKVEQIPFHECWEWNACRSRFGHGFVGIPGKKTNGLAHRLSWELSVGPIPEGLCVLHRCDNPGCVRPDHLFLGTQADNMKDKAAKGRCGDNSRHHVPRGAGHCRSKVSEAQVSKMREARSGGAKLSELSARYSLSEATVSRICRRGSWKHVF